ncbi:MAG: COG1361 S-layer family protein [Candidatus Woesearchaeota archaeon]
MKTKSMILIVILALILATMPIAQAQDEAQLTVDLLKYEPSPAQPGQYVTVTLELENLGNEDAKNAAIEVVDQFPFTIISQSEAREVIGNLKGQRSYVVDLKLKVSSEAVVGENDLKIRFTSDIGNNNWQETTKTIRVKSNQAALSISDVNTDPEEFISGEPGEVKLTVKNTADVVLRDIGVQLNLINPEAGQSGELPFTPVGSSEEQRVSKLNPGELKTLTYQLNTDAEARPGFYKIPVATTYFDEEGTEYEKTNIIGVAVMAKPQLKVFLDQTTIANAEEQGTATIKFVNKGIHDLKFLDVELLEGEGYTILSSDKDYIGDLDSDDYRTQDFRLKTSRENAKLRLAANYMDDNNKEYEQIYELAMRYDKNQEDNNGSISPILIAIIVVAGFFVIRGVRRHRKKKKQRE